MMPSRYSSAGSIADAQALCANLGIECRTLSVEGPFAALLDVLAPVVRASAAPDMTEENLQARVRGTLLMALSNKFGWLVLATGNKSELSVGYSTLYGDMVGGFAPIKDVYKTRVYDLARWRNCDGEVIPVASIDKPPSAELRAGQLDTDSLPPYEVLDPMLRAYVEDDLSVDEIVARGARPTVVEKRGGHGRRRRVQATAGADGHQDHPEGVRQGPPHAGHEPLPWLTWRRRAHDRVTAPRDILLRGDGIVLRIVDGEDPIMREVAELCYETLHRPFGVVRCDFWNETDPASTHLVALEGETLVGYARLLREGRAGHIRQVTVDPAYRRRGIGAQLVGAVLDQARAEGLAGVYLNARLPAVPMYGRLGFRVTGNEFRMPRTWLPHVRMVQRLR